MKYINSKKNADGRLDEDVVLELEYGEGVFIIPLK